MPYNPGIAPTLTGAEINNSVALRCTLTDGDHPGNPGAYPAQCAIAAGIPVPAASTNAAPE